MTEWKTIPGFSRYSVSDSGEVRRDVRMWNAMPGPVSISINADGYPQVSITSDSGIYKKENVHSLVALAFFGPRPEGLVVCHFDGDPGNCSIKNLRYDTYRSNVHDAIRHGTQVKGEGVVQHRITEQTVRRIVEMLDSGAVHYQRIADEVGATKYIVFAIASGWTWRHITEGRNRRVGMWQNQRSGDLQKASKARPTGLTVATVAGRRQRIWEAV